MREDKQSPSQKPFMQRPWFWPVIYSSMVVMIVAVIFSFNELYKNQQEESVLEQAPVQEQNLISTSTKQESLKYPFKEEYLSEVTLLQNFYDVSADEATRENSLLVFNQVFTTSTGVTIAMNSEPFEVVAAMSGTVSKVKMDVFTGNTITIDHPNGMQTRYSSVADVLIKEGDQVSQGEQIATSQENESNPSAGVHLHFELLDQGVLVNPAKYLSF
ncbi:stage II sporulation protein [Lysinibacillus sp. 2017]|uniref:M23 family metallopeptidase n=1 Tax=unclassified Lysinibacillus TaxID=2636778 RepID=UPI000D52671C|nr:MULTISPECIES: M23 family metallopeptidase [unclassified Lysinibacillus]AWE06313.1 stage II sporulation protein [Lysinibacillus sp. 2017]TGN35010.1 M23 family metallopeptidase [Lysinibacillus sp. S2017]